MMVVSCGLGESRSRVLFFSQTKKLFSSLLRHGPTPATESLGLYHPDQHSGQYSLGSHLGRIDHANPRPGTHSYGPQSNLDGPQQVLFKDRRSAMASWV